MINTDTIRYLWKRSLQIAPIKRDYDRTNIFNHEWDICLVLDGCRYDTFIDVIDPDANSIISLGSNSQEWIPRTFDDRDNSDTAYISGNPFSDYTDLDDFGYSYVEPVTEIHDIQTVDPESLRNHAIHVWENKNDYGISQMVVHFMQPHVPFRSHPEWFNRYHQHDRWGSQIWKQIDREIDRTEFFRAYRDNLSWVWNDAVTPISNNVDAEIVVTADHGNAAGEYGIYGHPERIHIDVIRRVPWYRITGSNTANQSVPVPEQTEYDATEQLTALGYR